jgi:hypothetical protein
MSVHYKFKSALEYDTVTFDGLHISIADLKTAITQQKRIGKTSDFDLQITNAQTKEGKQSYIFTNDYFISIFFQSTTITMLSFLKTLHS